MSRLRRFLVALVVIGTSFAPSAESTNKDDERVMELCLKRADEFNRNTCILVVDEVVNSGGKYTFSELPPKLAAYLKETSRGRGLGQPDCLSIGKPDWQSKDQARIAIGLFTLTGPARCTARRGAFGRWKTTIGGVE